MIVEACYPGFDRKGSVQDGPRLSFGSGITSRPEVSRQAPSVTNCCYVDLMTSHDLLETLRDFMAERDWSQFHSPENLAKSISIESGELLECFQWDSDGDLDEVAGELADVLTYALLLADKLELDPEQIVRAKLERTGQKYPIEKAKGRSTKYDRL